MIFDEVIFDEVIFDEVIFDEVINSFKNIVWLIFNYSFCLARSICRVSKMITVCLRKNVGLFLILFSLQKTISPNFFFFAGENRMGCSFENRSFKNS